MLVDLFKYCPLSGKLTWKISVGSISEGTGITGWVKYKGVSIKARELVWRIMTGRPSQTRIIFIDGDESNLAWDNLIEVRRKGWKLDYEWLTAITTCCLVDGSIRWRNTQGKQVAGELVGTVDATSGQRRVTMCGRKYHTRDLAWMHYYGVLPKSPVYYHDGDEFNHSKENLYEDQSSLVRIRKAKYNGIYWRVRTGKYLVRVTRGCVVHPVGEFDTIEEARRRRADFVAPLTRGDIT